MTVYQALDLLFSSSKNIKITKNRVGGVFRVSVFTISDDIATRNHRCLPTIRSKILPKSKTFISKYAEKIQMSPSCQKSYESKYAKEFQIPSSIILLYIILVDLVQSDTREM